MPTTKEKQMVHFDNAWHPQRVYKEWWYFTLFCDNGTKIAGALSVNQKNCDIWVSFYGKKVVEIERFYSLSAFTASTSECDVKIAKNTFSMRDGKILCSIQEDNFSLNFQARPTVSWEDNIIENTIENKSIRWIVPMLRGKFAGSVTIGGKKQSLKGIAFHDHVWHNLSPNLNLALHMKQWAWGILYSPKQSVLFVDVDYGPKPFRFFVHQRGKSIEKIPLSVTYSGTYPHKNIALPLVSISKVKNHKVPATTILQKLISPFFHRKYHGTGKCTIEGKKGEAYVETLRFRP